MCVFCEKSRKMAFYVSPIALCVECEPMRTGLVREVTEQQKYGHQNYGKSLHTIFQFETINENVIFWMEYLFESLLIWITTIVSFICALNSFIFIYILSDKI